MRGSLSTIFVNMAKEISAINPSKLFLIRIFTLILFTGRKSSACTVGSFDLTNLQIWGTWTVQTVVDSTSSTFFLNLCENVGSNSGSAVCDTAVSSCLKQGEAFINAGNHNETLQLTTNENTGGFRLDYRGGVCNGTEKHQTTIDFKCGTTLGSPNFLETSGCTYFFEWYSTVACSTVNGPALSEVPCSLYDSKGKKRDLSPLIKLKGGYLVQSPDADDLNINVCRDITPESDTSGPTAGCPAGSGGCLVKKGLSVGLGKPHLKLESLSDDELKLHYEGETILDSCSGFKPTMTMVFTCPSEQGRLTANRGPIQLSSTNCQYQIQWETEYACPVEMLTTDTCAFDQSTHGLNFDLSPLTKPADQFYLIEDDPTYFYYINICADITGIANCEGMAVCQVDKSGLDGTAAGRNSHHELRYTDGELSLIYKGGDVCNHNKFQRTSVISFQCNATQDPGKPEFVTETECTYFFQWSTKYACMAEAPSMASCRLTNGKQRYDLSPLTRQTGSNWLVLDGRHSHPDTTKSEYFLNVCSDVVAGDVASEGCPQGSSACVVDTVGSTKAGNSLGRFLTSPVLQNDLITLSYTDGDICSGSTKRRTDITFLCSPGDLESAPILVRKSDDGCQYDMEWHTAAACPLASKWGTDCRVFDDDAGVSFDLSPLSKVDGHYNVTVGDYDYFINVCTDVKLTPCNDASHTLPNPAACQSRLDGTGVSYILGQTNTSLGYFDGIIKLTYLHGKPYHSNSGTGKERMTEIAFLCDMEAGVGAPQFFQENNATYFFRWNTKYACPQQPIECVVTDEASSEQYDLSSLSKALEEENWSFVDETDSANRKKYYINVCRPINPHPHCGAFAGVCQTGFTKVNGFTETETIPNLGVPSSPPTIESSGHLLLTYENGSECGSNKRITSHIHFACNKGTLASTPRLLEVVDACTYSFLWETEAACPIGVSTGENCTVRDLNSDYVFNLQPLVKQDRYQVSGPNNQVFTLNVCGAATSCPAGSGSCLPTKSLGNASATPIFSDEGLLTLEYTGGTYDPSAGKHLSTVISFLCRRNASQASPRPVFVRQEDTRYIFDFETPLACLPESVDCLISDMNGNQYDLSPLAKDAGNWEAVDTRPSYKGLSYHINVCRPINKGDPTTSSCPGGPIGACQTSESDNSAFNLGYVQAMPEAAIDGALSLRYVNGDICHGKFHRSTRINFECSDTPGSPVFQTESSECEYLFSWETPAACPLERVTGGNCTVQVPEFGFQFNLSSLYNKTQDYTVSSTEHEYTINVCGPLVSRTGDCASSETVGACQKLPDGSFKNAGVFNKALTYANGVLKLNYTTGSVCHGVYQRSTAINFYCDENVKGKGEPHYIQETSDCTYIFEWATPLACPPFKVVECSYRDGESQYDLAPLSKMTDNYRVHSTTGNSVDGDAYFINVCRSLWHKKGAQGEFCPSNAAACLQTVDQSGKKSFISLGEVGQGPSMENGHLVLRYQSGATCPDGTGRKRSTVINIQCDKNSVGSAPILDHVDGNCEYHFLWLSNYACDITEHTEEPMGDCTAMNPVSGFRFDFNSLKNQAGYTVMGSDSHKYVINVCDPLASTVCDGSNIGSCQEELVTEGRHFNAGVFNKNLFFDDSILFLRYDFGHACHNNNYNRSSVINFVCPHKKDTLGEPVFIAESDDCTYFFSWHTSLACEKFIQCSVVNGSDTISLAPLINDQGYHLSTTLLGDGSLTYINLCRPLNPIPGLACHPNSAACQVKGGSPVNLGRVSEGPKIGSDGLLSITYTQGDRCSSDGTKNISSVIKFFCKQGVTQGTPTLEFVEDCIYQFTWGTNVVCPATAPESDQDCTFFNTALQYRFDFTALSKQDQTVVASSAKTMKMKLCGLASDQSGECSGAAVCLHAGQDKFSLGQLSTQTISQEGELFKVEYTGGSPCPSGANKKRQATILLICNRQAINTSPTFFASDENCHYSFRWETAAACPADTRPCDLAYEGNVYDLSPLSRITGSFQFHDSNTNEYYMNLCQPVYGTEGCPAEASMCRGRPNGQMDVLGMVYTQQMSAKGDVPDIEVTFMEGSNVDDCSTQPDSSPIPASSSITFQCANKIGNPEFQRTEIVDNKCQFQFLWKSKVACKEERVPVNMVNKMITDPETNVIMNFTAIMDHGTWEARGDDRQEVTGDHSSYVYLINMNDNKDEVPGDVSHVCQSAAVCQTKESDQQFFRDVGLRSSRKYFIEDELVEMEVTKPESCGKDNTEDVITTVIFQCETNSKTGHPEFYYESSNCQYYFLWLTSAVCTEGKIVITDDGGGSDTVVTSKHRQASIIILVLLIIIILCCLAIVFHKRERRSAVYWRIRGCCPGAYSKVPSYSYSQLSNGDAEDSNDGGTQSRSLFDFSEGGQEDEVLIRDTRRNPFEFHDDSDDDILPHV